MTVALQVWFFLVTLAILAMLLLIYAVVTDVRDLLKGLENIPAYILRLEELLTKRDQERKGNG